jgi:hypothetical protein
MIRYHRSLEEWRRRSEPDAELGLLGARIDETEEGGTLWLESGSYLTPVFIERSVAIGSSRRAVLVGVPGKPVVEIVGDDIEVELSGLIIRGGGGDRGAVAVTGSNVRLTLRHCVILDNAATLEGPAAGGVNMTGGALTMQGCLVAGNRGSMGGGLHVQWDAQLEARSCLFLSNVGTRGGGAAWVEDGSRARFVNCTFVDNSSEDGGMGFTLQAYPSTGRTPDVSLENCVIRSGERCFGYEGLGTGPIQVSRSILPEHAREYSVLEADDSTWFGVPEFAAEDVPYALSSEGEWPVEGDAGAWGDAQPAGLLSSHFEGGVPLGAALPERPASKVRTALGCLGGLVTFAVPVLLYLLVLDLMGIRDHPSVGTLHLVGGSVLALVVGMIISLVGESLIEDVVKFVLIGGGFAFVARGMEPANAALVMGVVVGTFLPIFVRYWTPLLQRLGLDPD